MLNLVIFFLYLKNLNQEITPLFCIKQILLAKNKKTTKMLKINFDVISLQIHPSNLNETKQILK